MARPQKSGLEYFPTDVDIFEDIKIFELGDSYGALGECIYFRLLCAVYRQGYYLEVSIDTLALSIYKSTGRWGRSKEFVKQVIKRIAELDLIDSELLAKGIITSASIQRRYLKATERRQIIDDKYWLIDDIGKNAPSVDKSYCTQKIHSKGVNATITPVNATLTQVNATLSTQRKENKSKVNILDNNIIYAREDERVELATNLWTQVQPKLEAELNAVSYEVWVKTLDPVIVLDGNTLVLRAVTASACEFVSGRFSDTILKCVSNIDSNITELQLVYNDNDQYENVM